MLMRPNLFGLAVERGSVKMSEVDTTVKPTEFGSSVGQVV